MQFLIKLIHIHYIQVENLSVKSLANMILNHVGKLILKTSKLEASLQVWQSLSLPGALARFT